MDDMLSEATCTAHKPQELQLEINELDSDDETTPEILEPVLILNSTVRLSMK
jgi:hypothetical protein